MAGIKDSYELHIKKLNVSEFRVKQTVICTTY